MSHLDRKNIILEKLKQEGLRITSQRKLLIDVILENECSSCKEIYYQATKLDNTVGIATVYRMVKTLEDLELINRKNLYNISYENLNISNKSQAVFISKNKQHVLELDKTEWFRILEEELKSQGLIDPGASFTIAIKENCPLDKGGELNDRLYYNCHCDNHSCDYNNKNNKEIKIG